MKLTPINGRGKGPRNQGFRPPNPNKRRKADDKDDGLTVRRRSLAAPVEKLPTEVLQRIFLYSEEVGFPLASLRIGRLLSHRSFYVETVLEAFRPTWDLWLGVIKQGVESYYGWYEDYERFGGDPIFQSSVIALPWMRADILTDAQQVWLRQRGPGLFYQHTTSSIHFFDNFSAYYDDEEWPEEDRQDFMKGVRMADGQHHGVLGHDHMKSAAACLEAEYVRCCENRDYGLTRLEVHPAIRIPDRLITGPWTMSDVKLLFWLVRNNAKFAYREGQGWEMTKEGLDNLWDQDSAEIASLVTYLFRIAGAFSRWPDGVLPVSFIKVGEKLSQQGNNGKCHSQCDWNIAYRQVLPTMRDKLAQAGTIPWA